MPVAGVLLVPEDDDPHKLLEGGVGGSRPPTIEERGCSFGHISGWFWGPQTCTHPDHTSLRLRPLTLQTGLVALILGCDGKVVPAGCFHALGFRRGPRLAGLIALRLLAIREGGTVDWSEVQAMVAHLGRLVFVDGDGVEVPHG